MEDSEEPKTEEEIVDLVADALHDLGFDASSQDTGGGICCVILERNSGGEIVWGTADVNWGASIVNEDGAVTSSIETSCPSNSQDIATIVKAMKGPSIAAGAIWKAEREI